ncbi:MAG: hypothetical protein V3S26_06845 [Acidimicrobiia bacterium]
MELEAEVLERVGTWESLSRWEKSELGKDLRRQGLSYGEIMELIDVKKSTLATWCREVKLTTEQIAAIKRRRAQEPGIPVDTQWKRRLEIENIRNEAAKAIPELINDPLWLAGVVLYWAEGAKTRNDLRLANADPRALRLFIDWVRAFLNPKARFSIQLHLHEGNDDLAAQAHWREQTGLLEANYYKTFIKPKGTGHRKNHLPHGVCTIKVRECSNAWQTTMAWIEGLTGQLGLDKPRE